ncbi:HNH endonuclease [Gulosibacter faecalis]|uniref:HNH endonuclease n=1 Tax=Gulosibacter faecalis TaxID=272240 RepID=A0ABW5UXH1_9MICO|nr:HNH endonuclease [Gulosibacter faecalis]
MAVDEIWRPTHIRGDRYEVSNLGRVRSNWCGGRILVQAVIPDDGHKTVKFFFDGKQRNVYVHQLVAKAFLEETGPLVRHLNGDPGDNRVANLAYGTNSDNMLDAVRHGTLPNTAKTHCVRGHQLSGDNIYVYPRGRSWERVCKECNRIRTEKYKNKKMGVAA